MGAATKRAPAARSDKKVECYPTLAAETIQAIDQLAAVTKVSRTSMAARIAHHCVWSRHVIDPLQPYLQVACALAWDSDVRDNVFHVWLADRTGAQEIRPCLERARATGGQRVKFRVMPEDRKRLQVLAYALGTTQADTLWPLLFGIALADGESLFIVTRVRGIHVSGLHPLTGDRVTAISAGTTLVV